MNSFHAVGFFFPENLLYSSPTYSVTLFKKQDADYGVIIPRVIFKYYLQVSIPSNIYSFERLLTKKREKDKE